MKGMQIGSALRKMRKSHGWTVNDVVVRLHDEYKMDVAAKTVYGWESDQCYPRTETLLVLCEMYQMDNISEDLLNSSGGSFPITADERHLIELYRKHPELQSAVKRVLDVPPEEQI